MTQMDGCKDQGGMNGWMNECRKVETRGVRSQVRAGRALLMQRDIEWITKCWKFGFSGIFLPFFASFNLPQKGNLQKVLLSSMTYWILIPSPPPPPPSKRTAILLFKRISRDSLRFLTAFFGKRQPLVSLTSGFNHYWWSAGWSLSIPLSPLFLSSCPKGKNIGITKKQQLEKIL